MTDIKEALRQIPLFTHLSGTQLQCILKSGTEIWLQPGTQIAQQGDSPDGFYIILAGQTEWTRNVAGQSVHAVTLGAGDVFAELILLLDEPYPTSGRALTEVHLFKLNPEAFWQMLEICPNVMRNILKIAAQRSQIHETVTQQQAKLISLGRLSAGLAHELNNPAAAAQRATAQLGNNFQTLQTLSLQLNSLTTNELNFIVDIQYQATKYAITSTKLDPLTQSDKEDEVNDWLEDHDLTNGWKLAPTLVNAGIDLEKLDTIANNIPIAALSNVLTWLETTLYTTGLINEIEQSTTRISQLVKAVKGYSYMDQAPLQEIDVHQGIENTLIILNHRLKKGVVVNREYDRTLPHICAYGSELNQVWTNLIDNAIDAMDGKGKLIIRTRQENDCVLVEIIDNGAGIPAEIQSRIFEPFFTTKGVGKGTGLGLEITRRIIVGQHKGDLRFESQPGTTKFQVRLPINLAKNGG